MADPLVDARGLVKTYATGGAIVTVLSGIDCRIAQGERIALIGPSGSGKTTLLHILAGLVAPSQGSISWPALGPRQDLMPTRLQAVFQAPSLFPALNVSDNIGLPVTLAGTAPPAGLTPDALLGRFGLTELATKLPEEISGGQAQRVAMLRALSIAPRLILADEPTGQLDSQTAQDFLTQVLAETEAAGTALVVATHDPAVAARLERQWVIDHGRLAPRGNGMEVRR